MAAELVDGRLVDAATAAQLAGVSNAADAVDAPHNEPVSAEFMRLKLRHGWDSRGIDNLVIARLNDEVVAYTAVELPHRENTHMAFAEMVVRPEFAQSGLGEEMLDHVDAVMKANERTLLVANAWGGSPLEQFWLDHGLAMASKAAQRRLIPADLDWDRLDGLHAESASASASYDVIEVPEPVPAELVGGMLHMHNTMNDAPLDDLALEDELWDEERLRDHELALRDRAMRNTCLAARHRDSGEVAGYTAVVVEDERPHLGFQEDTAVVRAHRGHRLGLRLKIEMLRLLRERDPQIQRIDTWNAVSNSHMIAVNDALGCFVVAYGGELQRDLAG